MLKMMLKKMRQNPKKQRKVYQYTLCIVIKLYKLLEHGEFCVLRRVSHNFAQACMSTFVVSWPKLFAAYLCLKVDDI